MKGLMYGLPSWVSLVALFACDALDTAPREPVAVLREAPAKPAVTPLPTSATPESEHVPCYVYRDDDGDGFKFTDYSACVGGFMPPFFGDDCDDTDSERHEQATFYSDRDGDGFGTNEEIRTGCKGESLPGFATQFPDCDDADPLLQAWAHRDADGDGSGAPAATCTATNASGYIADLPNGSIDEKLISDCDDSDPSVFPLASETALDQRDSNCDGFEFPVLHNSDGTMPLNVEPALSARCSGIGLSVVGVETWERPLSSGAYVYIANRGTLESPARLALTWVPNTSPPGASITWLLPPIAAGRVWRSDPLNAEGSYLAVLTPGSTSAAASSADGELSSLPPCAPVNQNAVVSVVRHQAP